MDIARFFEHHSQDMIVSVRLDNLSMKTFTLIKYYKCTLLTNFLIPSSSKDLLIKPCNLQVFTLVYPIAKTINLQVICHKVILVPSLRVNHLLVHKIMNLTLRKLCSVVVTSEHRPCSYKFLWSKQFLSFETKFCRN